MNEWAKGSIWIGRKDACWSIITFSVGQLCLCVHHVLCAMRKNQTIGSRYWAVTRSDLDGCG